MRLSLLVAFALAVSNAAVTRIGTDPITVARYVGQVVTVNVTVLQGAADAKTVTATIGYDPVLLVPKLPGGAVTVPGGSVTATLGTPGEVVVTFTGTCPADGEAVWTLPLTCLKAGTTQLTVKACGAKDGNAADILTTCDSLDTIVIKPKLTMRLLVQP